jgi:hypothetical protein
MLDALPYSQIWVVDFEFIAYPGERPDPICLVAWELRSGRKLRLWRDQFGRLPPYPIDADALFVAYYASAELGCHRVLGWPAPARILDLFTEFRDRTNGLTTPAGAGLLGALAFFGLDRMGIDEKQQLRSLVLRGGFWSEQEREAISDYCEGDVAALARLLPAMLPRIDLPRALLRGRYMSAAAAMEFNGTPIDMAMLEKLRQYWTTIQDQLIADIDANYGVFEGRTFKADRFASWLVRASIPWPRLESGKLDLSDDAFRQAARVYPAVAPLRELRSSLAEMRLSDLAVGKDGRNRTLLSAFRARTGRNQPSNAKFIFGPSVFLRGLIKPPPGYGIAYIDWSQMHTVFGWHVHVGENSNPRSLRNFPMQANGAEMLRLACCLATERGIQVCAPVHDAVVICAPLEHLEADVARMRAIMAEASRIVLDGFELGTDAAIVRHPNRYMDPRGAVMWDRVCKLVLAAAGVPNQALVA